jgi:electron transport complex protein RnfC
MILDFPGGARPTVRTKLGKKKIDIHESCSAVCLNAADDATVSAKAGTTVLRGALLGTSDGTPVYSPISGVFRGVLNLEGKNYFTIVADGLDAEERIFEPESRALTELTREDIIESARKFAIVDTRSGMPLWKLLTLCKDSCKRLVIDCTETDPESAINYRLGIEYAREIVCGAKILVRATGALRCVFAAEYYRNAAFAEFNRYAGDDSLFVTAQLEEKYPYGDRALMYALYVKTLKKGQTALDEGVLIVAPETAIALYCAMLNGMPQLDRFITVCGEGIDKGGNFRFPRGITLHDISGICGGIENKHFFIENSLLNGAPVTSAVCDSTHALIAAKPQRKKRTECISCARCAEVCPVKLIPRDVLAGDVERLQSFCVSCGACQYICPSGIPLMDLIYPQKEAK